jgi:hypothetical protein
LPHNGFWWDDIVTPKLLDRRNRSHVKIVNLRKSCLHRPSHVTRWEIASVSDAQVSDNDMLGFGISAIWIDPLNIYADVGALENSGVFFLSISSVLGHTPKIIGGPPQQNGGDREDYCERGGNRLPVLVNEMPNAILPDTKDSREIGATFVRAIITCLSFGLAYAVLKRL